MGTFRNLRLVLLSLSAVFFTACSDLRVAELSISPSCLTTETEITFEAVVENDGYRSSKPCTLAFKVGDEDVPKYYELPALSPGETYVVRRKEKLKVAQSYQNTVTVDVNNDVKEVREYNNQQKQYYTVEPYPTDIFSIDDTVTYNNDNCATPKVAAISPFIDTLDTTSATAALTDPVNSCTSYIDPLQDNPHSVWYAISPAVKGTVFVNQIESNYFTVSAVYTGSCDSLTEIACTNSSMFTFPVEANTTYFIKVVDSPNYSGGGGDLQFRLNYIGDWRFIETPDADQRLYKILIDPKNDDFWYIGTSGDGLYMTRDGGATWETHLSGFVWGLAMDPTDLDTVYAGSYFHSPDGNYNNLYRSEDKGNTWSLVHAFPQEEAIYSILVSEADNAIYVGMHWLGSNNPNGIYKSMDKGESWTLYPFNIAPLPYDQHTNLINWDIAEDAVNGILYAATEPAAKPPCMPECYTPPTMRSTDGGQTWKNVAGTPGSPGSLYWQATKIEVHPVTRQPYFQVEGGYLYTSEDHGDTWQPVSNSWNRAWDLLIDKNYPTRFFAGGLQGSGVSMSLNTGSRFTFFGPPGLPDRALFHVALNGTSTKLYAVFTGGVYVADLSPWCGQ